MNTVRQMNRGAWLTCLGMLSVVWCAAGAALPERIMSGYSGWVLGGDQSELRWIMDRMEEAAFNSVELKIHGGGAGTFDLESHLDEAESLMRYANGRGLMFQAYLYPVPSNARRHPDWKEHAGLPCVVDGEGKAIATAFLITDSRCWKQLFFPAFKLLKYHARLPFATLKFDLETTKPLAAPLDWSDIDVPDLKSVGDGTGEDRFIRTRERSVFYIRAKGGEEIKVALRHEAGAQRPIALHYVLLDDRKGRLREEVVNPGDTEAWSVVAPKTGVYALVVSGGIGGQAWYGVKIGGGLHYALDAGRSGAVIFREQAVCIPGTDRGNRTVRFACGHSTVVITPEGEPSFTLRLPKNALDLPLGRTKAFTFARHPSIGYFDAVDVKFPDGRCPYVWGSSGRGLAP